MTPHAFFGLPLWACAALSAVFTVVWSFVWPQDRVQVRTGFRYLVLRWGHAVTWAWLTLAALAAMEGWPAVARGCALAGLACYALFVVVARVSRLPLHR